VTTRRRFLGALGALALAAPAIAQAQSAGRVPHVAVLDPGSATGAPGMQRAPFERGLRELGWLPGATVVIEYVYGDGSAGQLTTVTANLLRRGVEVIVALGPVAIRAAREATTTVPIVMAAADDPIADGFVGTLARPGGNVTGIANIVSDLDGKRLDLLREAIPGLARVGVLTNPTMRPGRNQELIAGLHVAARARGLELQILEVTRTDEIPEAFAALARARVGALLVRADTQVLEPNRSMVAAMAIRHRLPAMYPWRLYAEVGGLMAYASSISGFHHRSAMYVDRILKGAKPGDLPVERPTTFELVINLKTADLLGLTLPPSLLARADEVIQ
jgi:putative tryptophan/tyrosine transport system substrate-binding protein